jgi:hypothetical protein
MNANPAIPRKRQYAAVALATTIVAGCPVGVVWWLRVSGTVTSAPFAVALGMGFSLWLSCFCRLIWETRPGSEDLLFSELMIWGYLHRRRSERRLANVAGLLAPIGEDPAAAHPRRQAKNVKLLEQLVAGLERNDPYLHGHSRRVARHAWMIARRMGLPGDEIARIRTAAAIHDVGKIHTPTAILHKPGRLTDAEYEVIKRHPAEGAEMAAVLDDDLITAIVRHHHERVDGSGYPNGLVGEEIPLGARIVAVADTFDAITSARPYRAASAHAKAIDILKEEAGTRLDPDVVKAFCGHYAGNRPLAVWSFLAGLPERFVTWLGGGAASIASAAKVVAVAALVGTTAATATVASRPRARSHHGAQTTAVASATIAYAAADDPALADQDSSPGASRAAGTRRRHRPTARGADPTRNAAGVTPSSQPAATQTPAVTATSAASATPVATPAPGTTATPPAGQPPAAPTGEEPTGTASNPKLTKKAEEELAAKKKREEAAKKKHEEATKLKKEEEEAAKAKAKAEKEAAAKLKEEEEAAARAKAEREAAEGKGVTTAP